jgi:hypothetical protein
MVDSETSIIEETAQSCTDILSRKDITMPISITRQDDAGEPLHCAAYMYVESVTARRNRGYDRAYSLRYARETRRNQGKECHSLRKSWTKVLEWRMGLIRVWE